MIALVILLLGALVPVGLFANRFLIPDTSYDTLNYHLFLGQRGLHTLLLPFTNKEFYPTGLFTFSPLHDTMNYLLLSLVGYRLGTLFSLVAYLLIAFFVYKIIEAMLPADKPYRNIGITLLIVNSFLVFELLFEIGTYYIEIENTLCMVIGIYFFVLFLQHIEATKTLAGKNTILLLSTCLFFGIALWGKLINLEYILPFGAVVCYLFWRLATDRLTARLITAVECIVLLIGFTVPLALFNLHQTGNPIFPFFNGIFHSKYYANASFSNPLFGGTNVVQKIFWPLFSIGMPKRLGEVHNLFNDYKLNLYWLVGVICLVLFLLKRLALSLAEQCLLAFFLLSSLLWSVAFGYLRYGTFLEIIGGIWLVVLFAKHAKTRWLQLAMVVVIGVLTLDNLFIIKHNLSFDISFRPSLKSNIALHRQQLPYLFARHTTLPASVSSQVGSTNVLVNCYIPSASYYVTTPFINKPMINLDPTGSAAMTQNSYYQAKVKALLAQMFPNRTTLKTVSISYFIDPKSEDLCIDTLIKDGFSITQTAVTNDYLGYKNIKLKFVFATVPIGKL